MVIKVFVATSSGSTAVGIFIWFMFARISVGFQELWEVLLRLERGVVELLRILQCGKRTTTLECTIFTDCRKAAVLCCNAKRSYIFVNSFMSVSLEAWFRRIAVLVWSRKSKFCFKFCSAYKDVIVFTIALYTRGNSVHFSVWALVHKTIHCNVC